MAQTVHLPAFAPKLALVLAVNEAEPGLEAAKTDAAKRAVIETLLGKEGVKLSHVDLMAIDDLDELGLSGYLAEGPGIADSELAPHRARLDALIGYVLVLYSGAFKTDTDITLGKELTLIATLKQDPTSWDAGQVLESKAATEPMPAKKKPSDAAMSGRIAMLALLVIALLTWAMILVA